MLFAITSFPKSHQHLGGGMAQWIANSLYTQQPLVRFSALPDFIGAEIYFWHCLEQRSDA